MTLEDFLSEWNNGSDRVLVHTSGSTGKPKPMMVEKKRMLNSARITCDFLGLKPGDSALLCMSLDYIAGKDGGGAEYRAPSPSYFSLPKWASFERCK